MISAIHFVSTSAPLAPFSHSLRVYILAAHKVKSIQQGKGTWISIRAYSKDGHQVDTLHYSLFLYHRLSKKTSLEQSSRLLPRVTNIIPYHLLVNFVSDSASFQYEHAHFRAVTAPPAAPIEEHYAGIKL